MPNHYYHSKDSVNEYIKLAKDVDGSLLIEQLKSFLASNSTILELGSGPGTDFQLLRKTYEVVGSDYSTEFLSHLKENNPKEIFLLLDAITLNTDLTFDGIYSNKVLQHLTNVELAKSIEKQTEILNQNGIICHSFWKGKGEEFYKGMLVNYQSKKSLITLFQDSFELLVLESYKEFEEKDSILLIARKK